MKKKVTAIIQARCGSKRLPNKVLYPLGKDDKPALVYLIERVLRAKKIDNILVVTTNKKEDWIIANYAGSMGCNTWFGKNEFVLDNILDACEALNIETIVDITADCPLICPKQIDYLVKNYNKSISDGITYVSNVIDRTFPRGFDLQVYDYLTLRKFSYLIIDQKHNSHSGWNIMSREKPEYMLNFVCDKKFSGLQEARLCIDEEEDYLLVRHITNYFKKNNFTANDVMCFLKNHMFLTRINQNIVQKKPGE